MKPWTKTIHSPSKARTVSKPSQISFSLYRFVNWAKVILFFKHQQKTLISTEPVWPYNELQNCLKLLNQVLKIVSEINPNNSWPWVVRLVFWDPLLILCPLPAAQGSILCSPHVPLCKAFQGVVRPWITIAPVLRWSLPGNITGQRILDTRVPQLLMLEVGEDIQRGGAVSSSVFRWMHLLKLPPQWFSISTIHQNHLEQRNPSDQRGDLIPSSTQKKPQLPLTGPRQVLGVRWAELILLSSELHGISLGSVWSPSHPSIPIPLPQLQCEGLGISYPSCCEILYFQGKGSKALWVQGLQLSCSSGIFSACTVPGTQWHSVNIVDEWMNEWASNTCIKQKFCRHGKTWASFSPRKTLYCSVQV